MFPSTLHGRFAVSAYNNSTLRENIAMNREPPPPNRHLGGHRKRGETKILLGSDHTSIRETQTPGACPNVGNRPAQIEMLGQPIII